MVTEDDILDFYKWIWTTHKDDYYLLEGNTSHFVIMRIIKEPLVASILIIEDNEAYILVQKKMLEMGIPVIDTEMYHCLMGLEERNHQ